jgi:hypothetical protein
MEIQEFYIIIIAYLSCLMQGLNMVELNIAFDIFRYYNVQMQNFF